MKNDREATAKMLEEWITTAREEGYEELDLFTELVEYGFTLDEFEGTSEFKYIKKFMKEHGLLEGMEKKMTWYAVMKDKDDTDWGYGSYDLNKAKEMCRAYGSKAYIAIIDEGDDPICIGKIDWREISKTYKDFHKYTIGSSDIARLVLVSPTKCEFLDFGEDGTYSAYIVDDKGIEIPDHYHKVFECKSWLKIYDDDGLTISFTAKEIEVFRAGMMGCIVYVHWR